MKELLAVILIVTIWGFIFDKLRIQKINSTTWSVCRVDDSFLKMKMNVCKE